MESATDTSDLKDGDLARYYIAQIELAEKDDKRQTWVTNCKKILERYREERTNRDTTARKRGYAMLWSNIETLSPAVYARTPVPVVSRRFKDNDPVARTTSEVLERALAYSVEAYSFSSVMLAGRDQYLLLGLGQAWVRYCPKFKLEPGKVPKPDSQDGQIANDPEPLETVEWEETRCDALNWADFLTNMARSWAEVWFVARRAFLTREELVARFGKEIGEAVPLDWKSQTRENTERGVEGDKACIYELWDKRTRRVVWISKGYNAKCLDEKDDPLGLKDFFPCPKPLLGTTGPDTLSPVPDFIYYQDQADEINTLTERINLLADALKVRGFYASTTGTDLNNLFNKTTNVLIPVDTWAALKDNGGIKGLIEWFPIEQVIETLKACVEMRKQLIDDVWQITGISDIMRGDTDPNETKGAQVLKSNWGSSRVRNKQKALAEFARDLIDIQAQIIATRFDAETLAAMTNVKLFKDDAEKQATVQQMQMQAQAAQAQWQQAAQMAQQAGQQPPPQPQPPPVPPELQDKLQSPTWADVMGLLRDNMQRSFRIDVETDSTIEPNDQEEKQRRVEFVEAIGQLIGNALPVMQAAPPIVPVVAETLKFLVRGFRVGRSMEDVIDRSMDQLEQLAKNPSPQAGPPGPNPQAEMAKAQAAQTSAQASLIGAQSKAQSDQQSNQIEAARVASDHQLGQAQVAAENARTHVQAVTDVHATIQKAEAHRLTTEVNANKPISAETK